MFLSQALWKIAPQLGHINFIEAPMGSGKTRYTAYYPVFDDKKAILVTPLSAAQLQAATNKGRYTLAASSDLPHLLESWAFGANAATNPSRYVVTVQSLVKHQHLMNWDNVAVVFVDEGDWVVNDLPKWERNSETTKAYEEFIKRLAAIAPHTMVIFLSATGIPETAKKVDEITGANMARICETEGRLRELPRQFSTTPSAEYLLLSQPDEPLAAYYTAVKDCVSLKNWCEERGLRVATIVSEKAKHYSMTPTDLEVRRSIIEEEKVPDWVQVLIYNDTFQRGVNIKESHIKRMFVANSESGGVRAETQAHGRFRYEIEVYKEVRWSSWCQNHWPRRTTLAVKDKKVWHKAMGFPTWKAWKEELESKGYTVRTNKGVVEIAANSDSTGDDTGVAGGSVEKITTPTTPTASYAIFTGPKGMDVVDELLEGMVEVIGLQKDMWFTKEQLGYVYGFGSVTAARDYAKEIGCGFVSARKQICG